MSAFKFLVYFFFFALLTSTLSACQGFLEDYDYSPIGNVNSNNTY